MAHTSAPELQFMTAILTPGKTLMNQLEQTWFVMTNQKLSMFVYKVWCPIRHYFSLKPLKRNLDMKYSKALRRTWTHHSSIFFMSTVMTLPHRRTLPQAPLLPCAVQLIHENGTFTIGIGTILPINCKCISTVQLSTDHICILFIPLIVTHRAPLSGVPHLHTSSTLMATSWQSDLVVTCRNKSFNLQSVLSFFIFSGIGCIGIISKFKNFHTKLTTDDFRQY